jgi:putative ABC transport system permease protein
VDRGIRADVVLKAANFGLFSTEVATRLDGLPELSAVEAFRFGNARIAGNAEIVTGADPAQLPEVVDLRVQRGRIGSLDDGGILVSVEAAREYGVGLGDQLRVQFPTGFQELRVSAIYAQEDFTGGLPVAFVVTPATFDVGFGPGFLDILVYARVAPGVSNARSAIHAALRNDFPNVRVLTRAQYRSDQEHAWDQILTVMLALLLLALLIAVLGIANTLALSTYERTHELGVLRAMGMSRRQVRRMIRAESAVVAAVGGLVGLAVGLIWGWAFVTAVRSQGLEVLHVPFGQLIAFAGIAALAGLVAGVVPAWRAARLPIVEAVAAD